ncbi:hypothetical protein BD769DRAFT_1382426 [Suillus cothurnatus]|nr:hypothetical protein BD769DRAFT_1382426 [Suillus cothurnatus]
MAATSVTQKHAVNYTPRDSVPRSLGDQSSVEWNILQDLPTDVSLNLVLTTREGCSESVHSNADRSQAQALKALDSKIEGYFGILIEKLDKIGDTHDARLDFHESLIEEQRKGYEAGFEDLAKRIKELDMSVLTKLGAMIRGATGK